jgi:hypothetical protein
MLTLGRKSGAGVDSSVVESVRVWAVWAVGVKDVDLGRLPDAEQHEAVRLIEKADLADGQRGGIDWLRLEKHERTRLEGLLTRAAGMDGNYFERRRQEEQMAARFRQLGAEARRGLPFTREAERDFFAALAPRMASGHLRFSHVALLVALLAQLQSGETLAPGSTIENNELVIDLTYGLMGRADPNGEIAMVEKRLKWLAKHEWITISEEGRTWRISLGPKTLAALRGAWR